MGTRWIGAAKKGAKPIRSALKSIKKKHDTKADSKARKATRANFCAPEFNELIEILGRKVAISVRVPAGGHVSGDGKESLAHITASRELNNEAKKKVAILLSK